MIWVTRIILLLIVIGIIRNYPKFSLFCAIGMLLIYVNSDPKTEIKKNDKINQIENTVNKNIRTDYSNGFKQRTKN